MVRVPPRGATAVDEKAVPFLPGGSPLCALTLQTISAPTKLFIIMVDNMVIVVRLVFHTQNRKFAFLSITGMFEKIARQEWLSSEHKYDSHWHVSTVISVTAINL